MNAGLVALDGDHDSILVWVHQNQNPSLIQFSINSAEVIKVIKYRTQKEGTIRFGIDQGVSASVDTNMLSPIAMMKPILENI